MSPTEHITADLAAIGLAVASTREIATAGGWGVIDVTLTDGRRLLPDYGPDGVHAWRWPREFVVISSTTGSTTVHVTEWSTASATSASDALAIFEAQRGAR